LRETADEIPWLQAHPRGECAQGARAEQRMQLFAEDRNVYVAEQPGTRDHPETQLFHAFQDAARGTLSLNEVDDGGAECFAGRLSPKGWKACRSFHVGAGSPWLVRVWGCSACRAESARGAIAAMWIADSTRMKRVSRKEILCMAEISGSPPKGVAAASNRNGEALNPLTIITQNL
jgi:hypothetical protein